MSGVTDCDDSGSACVELLFIRVFCTSYSFAILTTYNKDFPYNLPPKIAKPKIQDILWGEDKTLHFMECHQLSN